MPNDILQALSEALGTGHRSSFTLSQAMMAEHAGGQMLFLAEDPFTIGRSFPLSKERPSQYTVIEAHGGAKSPRVVRADAAPTTMTAAPPPTSASVAIVSVAGPLMQRSTAPGPCSEFVAGYDSIAESYCAAHASDADTVTMLFDSPGGVVPGLFPALTQCAKAKADSGKPVVGHMGPLCASAAYAIASVLCDVLVLSESGYAGSIGCRAGAYNISEMNAKEGISFTGWGWPPPPEGEKASGKLANHPDMPPTALGDARGQRDVSDMGAKFGQLVADSRGTKGLDMAAVLALHADMLRGPAAVAAGLADMLGEEADALALAMSMAVERHATTPAPVAEAKPKPDDGDEDDKDDDDDRDGPVSSVRAPMPAPATSAHRTGDPMHMAAFAALVGLGADATEPAVLAALTPIAGLAKATMKAAATTDPEDARGWLKRAGQALTDEPGRVSALATAQAKAETAERFKLGDDLVAKGYDPGRVFLYGVEGETATNPGTKVRTGLVNEYAAPKMVGGEEIGMSLGTLRGFVRRAPTLAGAPSIATPFEPKPPKKNDASNADVQALASRAQVSAETMAHARSQMDAAFSEGASR